jgi:hypothetical protein
MLRRLDVSVSLRVVLTGSLGERTFQLQSGVAGFEIGQI